jgi:hypothetical protein
MKNLFLGIAETHAKLEGWCDIQKAYTLASMVVALRPEVTVEIGVYGGKSFIPMALAHRFVGSGKIIGIDPWSKEVAVSVQPTNNPQHKEWWSKIDIEAIYTGFSRKIDELDLRNYVTIHRKESKFVSPPPKIGLLHIDGAHNDVAISDAKTYGPRVAFGGFCIMDDTDGGHGDSPAKAEKHLLTIGFKRLYVLGTGSVLQRTG